MIAFRWVKLGAFDHDISNYATIVGSDSIPHPKAVCEFQKNGDLIDPGETIGSRRRRDVCGIEDRLLRTRAAVHSRSPLSPALPPPMSTWEPPLGERG